MKMIRVGIAVALMVVMITACSALGLEKADSVPQTIAYADGQITAANNAVAASLKAKQIDVSDADKLRDLTKNAAYFSDAAKEALTVQDAQSNLALATSVLLQVQKYLNERSGQ